MTQKTQSVVEPYVSLSILGMEYSQRKSISKVRTTALFTRNTSCSGRWIRLVVQTIFATITVVSFIFIVIMAVKNPPPDPAMKPKPEIELRCRLQGCRVICEKAPYFDSYEGDIICSVMEAETRCNRVYLELHEPHFTNSSLPDQWLSRLRTEVNQISIIGGNLMHIPSGAFMSQFSATINILVLQDIKVKTLEPDSLVGLSNLRVFNILNSWIEDVQENALRAVDDNLETLTITESGDWDPINFSGFRGLEKLTIVDFSHNNFDNILNNRSFVGLEVTKIMYLNSCRITSIGVGTFDRIVSIEVLYLNNNMLTTVSPGLFDVIVPLNNPRARINLQDNYWFCDCSVYDLRQLIRNDILLVDVMCTHPDKFASMSFSQFDFICSNSTDITQYNTSHLYNISQKHKNQIYPKTVSVDVNVSYCINDSRKVGPTIINSLVKNDVCSLKKFQYINLTYLVNRNFEFPAYNKWLKFSQIITTTRYSIVQVGAMKEQTDFGLLWYQLDCPYEIFCLGVIPTHLKLYSKDPDARYRFCPIYIKNASVDNEECVDASVSETEPFQNDIRKFSFTLYISTVVLSLCFGAVFIYGLIRIKPSLLKGSKRILFVKHRDVDALVLPPKLPLRKDLFDSKDKEVFTLTSGNNDKLIFSSAKRMKSVRSNKSGTASYISAMQPTEDQLAEWRIRHHFNNELVVSCRKLELSTLSWIDTAYYCSLDDGDRTYESLK